MRASLLTIVPMFAAAAFVWIGGERLARKEIETRHPADRERLLDFATLFDEELSRLELLYHGHLDSLAESFHDRNGPDLEIQAAEIAAIRRVQLFNNSGDTVADIDLRRAGEARLPDLVAEGGSRPLNPKHAVVLPGALFEPKGTGNHGWIDAPDLRHRIYWQRPDPLRLVAFVIDATELRALLNAHLIQWSAEPLGPLRDSDQRVALSTLHGAALFSLGDARRGPAALLMPFRTTLGEWEIQAWDGMQVRTEHDSATLALAGTAAAILALGGLVLFIQQRRALRLAEERVSFVNRVSHEFGAPLTNVALNLDLAGEALEAEPKETRRRLAIVTEEVERLARLVANVLTFSRRERRTLEIDPQPCAPDDVIGKTLDSFRPALRRRGIEADWQAKADTRVVLDPDALGQIVGNLVSNVEKYAADGQWLGISSALRDGLLVVTVADRGPGIPERSRERVFRPFERVHREVNEGASGTGLGLTIARELAQRMGGSLDLLESDGGTRFELRIPAPPVLAVVKDDESSAA